MKEPIEQDVDEVYPEEEMMEFTVTAAPKKLSNQEIQMKRIKDLMGILSASIVVPSPTGEPYVHFLLDDNTHRSQIQDYIMMHTMKYLNLKPSDGNDNTWKK